jgi:MYXO-CTERM domain-containing protein
VAALLLAGGAAAFAWEPSTNEWYRTHLRSWWTTGTLGKLTNTYGKGGVAWVGLALAWALRRRLMAYRLVLAAVLGSFPSGDVTAAVAGAAVMASEGPVWAVATIGTAVLVGVRRMERNKHFLSDVLFGALIGFLIARFLVRSLGSCPPWWNRCFRTTGLGGAVIWLSGPGAQLVEAGPRLAPSVATSPGRSPPEEADSHGWTGRWGPARLVSCQL